MNLEDITAHSDTWLVTEEVVELEVVGADPGKTWRIDANRVVTVNRTIFTEDGIKLDSIAVEELDGWHSAAASHLRRGNTVQVIVEDDKLVIANDEVDDWWWLDDNGNRCGEALLMEGHSEGHSLTGATNGHGHLEAVRSTCVGVLVVGAEPVETSCSVEVSVRMQAGHIADVEVAEVISVTLHIWAVWSLNVLAGVGGLVSANLWAHIGSWEVPHCLSSVVAVSVLHETSLDHGARALVEQAD